MIDGELPAQLPRRVDRFEARALVWAVDIKRLLPVPVALFACLSLGQLTPRGYLCQRASEPIAIDGKLDDAAWADANWSEEFVDIEGGKKPKPRFRTRMKMLWDDNNLYIAADLSEPHVRATLTAHDSVIFHDNDFEVFLDPDGDGHLYSELELNALNTTWDLLLIHPYRAGGPPVDGWEIAGLKTGVNVNGSINDPSNLDYGWTVEIAIPWTSLKQIAGCPTPPKDGDQWRINFSRVEWQVEAVDGKYQNVAGTPEDNWVWSPQGVVNMHVPERWGYIQFASGPGPLKPLPGWDEKLVLAKVWDAENAFREKNGHWSGSLKELGITEDGVKLQITDDLFEASYRGYKVDQTLRFWKAK